VDPISARDRRDVRPHRARFRGGACESFFQICRHRGFRFFCRRRDLEGDNVARVCARTFAKLPVNLEPVAFLAVGLQRGLKREAIDGGFNCRDPARRKLRTSILWQYEKGPGFGVSSLRRAEESRFETTLEVVLVICFVSLIANGRSRGRSHRLANCMSLRNSARADVSTISYRAETSCSDDFDADFAASIAAHRNNLHYADGHRPPLQKNAIAAIVMLYVIHV
jgi:hypothetical protein